MLLDARHRVRGCVALREHHGLTAEGAALGTADIEHVAEPRELGQRHIALVARERIGQARAVHKERYLVLAADLMDGREIGLAVERAELRWERNIRRAREHHVLVVAVLIEQLDKAVELGGVHLAVVCRNGEHLVSRELDGAGLMAGHMARLGRDHALVGSEQHVEHDLVGLRAADQEEHLGLGGIACGADQLLGMLAVPIHPIARHGFHVGIGQCLQHRRVRAEGVIVLERDQCVHRFPVLRSRRQCDPVRARFLGLNLAYGALWNAIQSLKSKLPQPSRHLRWHRAARGS